MSFGLRNIKLDVLFCIMLSVQAIGIVLFVFITVKCYCQNVNDLFILVQAIHVVTEDTYTIQMTNYY